MDLKKIKHHSVAWNESKVLNTCGKCTCLLPPIIYYASVVLWHVFLYKGNGSRYSMYQEVFLLNPHLYLVWLENVITCYLVCHFMQTSSVCKRRRAGRATLWKPALPEVLVSFSHANTNKCIRNVSLFLDLARSELFMWQENVFS